MANPTGIVPELDLALAEDLGRQLRVDSVRASTAAGSGHPTSSMSAADLLAVLVPPSVLRLGQADRARQRSSDLLEGACVAAVVCGFPGVRSDH
jgi:transketolase N-terminal domain/subunit